MNRRNPSVPSFYPPPDTASCWRHAEGANRPDVAAKTGGTRGGAKDGSIEVKAQAVILYWKKVANGALKMDAYDFAAASTNQSASHVRKLVAYEDEGGVPSLASRRDNCGAVSDFSPGKKAKLEQVMEETDWEPTQRQCQEALGLGSHHTAARCAFRLLHPVMALINNHNGGNNFKLPHTGIRKAMRADGWEI